MLKHKHIWGIAAAVILTVIAAHAFFLYQWTNDTYMAGPNDGLNQMGPFKQLLYDHYTSGEFFYSFQLGLGGSMFTQLGYYYSTNLFFYFQIAAVYTLELLGLIREPDAAFWTEAVIFISMVRMTLVSFLTYACFRYMKLSRVPALTGALLYATCVMYFRHAAFWEFFADAFIWLPLLVYGVEKIIREKKPLLFIFALAATVFSNFYFSYIVLIFIGIYILARWLIRLGPGETKIGKQILYFGGSSLLGFGIGLTGFFAGVYGYFNNYRPDFEQEIVLFDNTSNILLDSRFLIVPTIFLVFAAWKQLYKDPRFVLFTILALLFIVFHYSPLMGSVFNGLSAPRNRFEYIAAFLLAGAVAAGVQHIRKLDWRELVPSLIFATGMYVLFYLWDDDFSIDHWSGWLTPGMIIISLAAFIVTTLTDVRGKRIITAVFAIMTSVVVANQYQYEKLFERGSMNETTQEFLMSEDYMDADQIELLDEAAQEDPDALSRTTWIKDPQRTNTPLYLDFYGAGAYSSILNEELLMFYYNDLQIDLGRESISRYSDFGRRANIYSLLRGEYAMFEKDGDENVPYGFTPFVENDDYIIYQNENVLPFVRTTDQVYAYEDAKEAAPLAKEHAMLNGVILENPDAAADFPQEESVITRENVEAVNGTYENEMLTVTGEEGGLNIIVPENEDVEEYYVDFLLRQEPGVGFFRMNVNEFETSRKARDSLYRTDENDLTIRVENPEDNVIEIRMPEGEYHLEDLAVYGETYEQLNEASAQAEDITRKVEVDGNEVDAVIENDAGDTYAVMPIPYEKGWRAKVNGERVPVEKANGAFTAVPLEEGENNLSLTYYPPYFWWMTAVSVVSLILAVLWGVKRRRKQY